MHFPVQFFKHHVALIVTFFSPIIDRCVCMGASDCLQLMSLRSELNRHLCGN